MKRIGVVLKMQIIEALEVQREAVCLPDIPTQRGNSDDKISSSACRGAYLVPRPSWALGFLP